MIRRFPQTKVTNRFCWLQPYVLDSLESRIAPATLLHGLYSPSLVGFESFGNSVSLSGNLIAVGAMNEDTWAPNSGQAYVFNASTGALTSTLVNPSPASDISFGHSVSVASNTVIVGVILGGAGINQSAYILNATMGNLIQTIYRPISASDDYYGFSVSASEVVSGSVTGIRLLVGAPASGRVDGGGYGTFVGTLRDPSPMSGIVRQQGRR